MLSWNHTPVRGLGRAWEGGEGGRQVKDWPQITVKDCSPEQLYFSGYKTKCREFGTSQRAVVCFILFRNQVRTAPRRAFVKFYLNCCPTPKSLRTFYDNFIFFIIFTITIKTKRKLKKTLRGAVRWVFLRQIKQTAPFCDMPNLLHFVWRRPHFSSVFYE